ncbi:MAG: TetR/AcrR family transcriptional regulator [Candidatus Pristimantibacillus sp.]
MSTIGRRKDSQEVSKHILHTAKCLFAEHGVGAVSMHQVAKAAHIGQATLYRRYANKSDLCMELMEENFKAFANDVRNKLDAKSTMSVQDRLTVVAQRLILFLDKEFEWISVINLQSRQCEANDQTFFNSPPYQFLFATYHSLLSEALKNNEIVDIDITFTAHILITGFPPESYMYVREVLGYTSAQIADYYCQSFIKPLFKVKTM